ncbi:hypothetical protein GQC79_005242 [Salmonella enterica]|nr:hypothetical protein [Salmonella enterica]
MIEEKLSTCLKSVVIYRIWPFESTIETSAFGTDLPVRLDLGLCHSCVRSNLS